MWKKYSKICRQVSTKDDSLKFAENCHTKDENGQLPVKTRWRKGECPMKQMKENEELKRLNEVSFMLNDLAVYLDEHPSDGRAAEWFEVYDDAARPSEGCSSS